MTPSRRARLAVASLGLVPLLAAAGCGIQPTGVRIVGAEPTVQPAGAIAGSQAPGQGAGDIGYRLYFFRGGKISPVQRYATGKAPSDASLIDELLAGPNASEQAQGYDSAFDGQKTALLSTAANNKAWAYEFSGGLTQMERAEIVCTIEDDLSSNLSVGTMSEMQPSLIWYACSDFYEYGAPLVPLGPDASDTVYPDPASS